MASMLIGFPVLWLAVLGWSGWAVGTGVGQAISSGIRDPGQAGEQGAQAAQNAATGVVKKR